MKFWVDAQLPPMLATWLSTKFDVEAVALRDLGLRDSTDRRDIQGRTTSQSDCHQQG